MDKSLEEEGDEARAHRGLQAADHGDFGMAIEQLEVHLHTSLQILPPAPKLVKL